MKIGVFHFFCLTYFVSFSNAISLQVGEFSSETGERLEEGQIFRLDLDEAKGDNKRVMLPHPEIIEASEVGHTLLVDDGKVKLRVSGKVSLSREALRS